MNKHSNSFLKALPFLLCLVLMLFVLFSGKELSVQTILEYTPENPLLAALVLMVLYALKSMSYVFPIIVLQIAAGHLFALPIALLVNFLGRAVTLIIPYGTGLFSGSGMVEHLLEKYPKLEEAVLLQQENSFFSAFFLRTLCFLPGDAVSLYFGATKMYFPTYFFASLLGSAPGVILATVLGSSISDPGSPAFWISILLMALFALGSLAIHLYQKKKSRQSQA